MRIIFTSDLHGNTSLYRELLRLAERFDVHHVIVGGDLFPMEGAFHETIKGQIDFVNSFLGPALSDFLARNPRTTLHFLHGNGDWRSSLAALETLEQKGIIRLLHDRRHELGQ